MLSSSARLALLHHPSETPRRDAILAATFSPSQLSNIQTYPCDIADPTSVTTTFHSISTDLAARPAPSRPFPSILINAAGYVSLAPLDALAAHDAERNLSVNIMGPLLTSQAFARMYFAARTALQQPGAPLGADAPKAPPGRIVHLSSQAAHVALPAHGAYCASKAGLLGLTRVMALEWGGRGISTSPFPPWVAAC